MIKPIEEKYLEECLSVIHAAYLPVALQFGITEQNCPYRAHASLPLGELRRQLERGDFMYGYFLEHIIVGFISFSKTGDVIKFNDLVVLPEYRHNGYGAELLDFLKEQAAAHGARKIMLGMIDENTILKDWYIKNGFTTTGTKRFGGAPFTVGYMEWVRRRT